MLTVPQSFLVIIVRSCSLLCEEANVSRGQTLDFQSTALPTELPSRDGSERQRLFSTCQIFLWSLTKKKNLTEVFYRQQTR